MKMTTKAVIAIGLVAALMLIGGSTNVSAQAYEYITFDPPNYPSDVSGLPKLDGLDGWLEADADEWIVFTGGYDGSHVAWNNAGTSVNAGRLERNFANSRTAGVLTYQVRPNTSVQAHWLLAQDAAGSALMLQLFAEPANQGQSNTDNQFRMISAAGTQYSPDTAAIDFAASAWYQVMITFNLADMTGGPNGTFDLNIVRLDTGATVWNVTDLGSVGAVGSIGKFVDNGSVATSGFATLIDNISFVPEPNVALLSLLGGGLIALRPRQMR